jgi:hypothetical protein
MLQKDRQKIIDKLDGLCRDFIRKRAIKRCGGCERCHKQVDSYKKLEWAHNQRRGKFSVRYDPDNAAGCCHECHVFIDLHRIAKADFFRNLLGEERYRDVNRRSKSLDKIDFESIELYLREELEKINERD